MPNAVTYVGIIERIPGKEFHAQFPDFPGVRVSDATIEDVGSRSSQVLRAHIDQLLQANEGVPRPISVDEVKEDEDGRYRHGLLIRIDVEVPESCLYTRSRCCAGPSSEEDEPAATPGSPE